MFGGAEPAGDQITEETVIFAHRLEEEEEMLRLLSWKRNISKTH